MGNNTEMLLLHNSFHKTSPSLYWESGQSSTHFFCSHAVAFNSLLHLHDGMNPPLSMALKVPILITWPKIGIWQLGDRWSGGDEGGYCLAKALPVPANFQTDRLDVVCFQNLCEAMIIIIVHYYNIVKAFDLHYWNSKLVIFV